MIVKYITELLLDHECVIVPEFGAFITKESPAMLDYVNHVLTPPSKELAFNGQLVNDDGLLTSYIAEHQGITMAKATGMVHEFAMRSLAVLESSGVLRLDGMGVLTRVTEREYIFQLDESLNLLGDAFGLATFTVQPIFRKETYRHLADKIATEQKAKNTMMRVQEEKVKTPHRVNRYNYKWFRAAAYSMMIATILVFLGWGAGKSNSKFALWNPFFYSSPNEFIANHLNIKMGEREIVNVETLESIKVNIPFCEKSVEYIQPVDNELLKPVVITEFYYIIGASLQNDNDAKRCVDSFKKLGFDEAMALPKNPKGNVRVAYELVMGKEAAVKRLEIIKKEYNKAAWLLRKK